MILTIGLFILGLILIVKGGDIFVDSAINISKISGLPEILIGATIVSFATALPELIVSVTASLKGYSTMSFGNGVGSIICNIGLILGLVNIISPTKIRGRIFIVKSLSMIICFSIMIILSLDGYISKFDGFILLQLLFCYMYLDYLILNYRKDKGFQKSKYKLDKKEIIKIAVNFVLGLLLIIFGSNLIINNGVSLAHILKIPEAIVSLTLIALGTSLPELVSCITALKKGHQSMSIGNILGSNVINATMVIGTSGVINKINILKQNVSLDYPIALLLMSILIFPTFIIKKVSRFQGALLLITYISYITMLYMIYM